MSDAIPLRNDHTVYVLGAGFSRARGLPLINGFLNRLRDAALWCEENNRPEARAIHEVLKFRLASASAAYRVPIDLENIEELFSLASAADPNITSAVKLSIAETLAYCLQQVPAPQVMFDGQDSRYASLIPASKPGNSADPSQRMIDLYDLIAFKALRANRPSATSIISFNYDDIVERALSNIGATYHYGFEPEMPPSFASYNPAGIPVLKLHGSVNWARREKGESLSIFKDYAEVRKLGLIPQLVPPTWNKLIADELSEVWSSAILRLSTATKVVILGFSIPATDLHFKYLLAAGLKENFSLREIVFVDPSEVIRSRAAGIFAGREIDTGRVRFVPSRIESLVANDAGPDRYWISDGEIPY